MSNDTEHPDPEDMFRDTRMSFGDHIEDLRTHLLRALKGFAIGMLIGLWPLGRPVLAIIVDPLDAQLYKFEKRKLAKEKKEQDQRMEAYVTPPIDVEIMFKKDQLQRALGIKPTPPVAANADPPVLEKMSKGFEGLLYDLDAHVLLDKENLGQGNFVKLEVHFPDPKMISDRVMADTADTRRPKPSTMHITEAFMVYFKVALMTGLVISSPWVFYHIWMFIAAGLYPSEKKLVNVYLPFSLFLFLTGAIGCQFLVMPRAVEALLWFNEWLDLSADLRLNEWLSFALMMPLVFGVSFQTPLMMMFLHKVGILSVQTYRDYRRMSWFVMAVFAAMITPTVDALSMMFLWVPMCALYELGILLCVYQGQQEALAEWEQEEKSNELVEV